MFNDKINQEYLKMNRLKVEILGSGFAWLDTGTPKSLLDAGHFIQTIELRQGYKIACLEEIAFFNKWISKEKLLKISKSLSNEYGDYLAKLVEKFNN